MFELLLPIHHGPYISFKTEIFYDNFSLKIGAFKNEISTCQNVSLYIRFFLTTISLFHGF